MASSPNKTVAVIDDHRYLRESLKDLLEAAGYECELYESAETFLSEKGYSLADCILADVRMPGMSGLELQSKLNADHCPIPTIFITAHGEEKMRLQAMRGGAVKFLVKPFDDEALLEAVRAALKS